MTEKITQKIVTDPQGKNQENKKISAQVEKATAEQAEKGKHRFSLSGITTIKISSLDLTLQSKTIAVIRSTFKDCILSQSSILVNSEDRQYFTYINLQNDKLVTHLQEVSPFGRPSL